MAREPLQRRAIDERIVFAYLTARRWRPAVEHFERSIEAQAGPISANVLVEVLRAYGELGERVRAGWKERGLPMGERRPLLLRALQDLYAAKEA